MGGGKGLIIQRRTLVHYGCNSLTKTNGPFKVISIIYSCAYTPLGLCALGRHRKAAGPSLEASLLPVYVGKIVEQSEFVLTHMRPPVDSLLKYTRGSFGVDLPDFLDLPVAEPDTYDVNEIENAGVGSAAILAHPPPPLISTRRD